MSDTYLKVKEKSMTDLADAIRGVCGTSDPMTIAQMVTNINNIQPGGIPINPEDQPYVRPTEYPDLDSINIPDDFEGLYLTYDLRLTPGYGWIGLFVQTRSAGATYTVQRGHLEDGEFIPDYSVDMISENSTDPSCGRYFRQDLDEANGQVQLWRVFTGNSIGCFRFVSKTTTVANNPHIKLQPCVERVGQLGYVWEIASNTTNGTNATVNNNGSWSTYWLRRCKVRFTGKASVNRLQNAYANSYSLQDCDVSGWNTTDWGVTHLGSMFYQCAALQHLDLSYWDTSNWAVTSLSGMFNGCYKLKDVNMSWNTTNWNVAAMDWMFSDCVNLETIRTNWNTQNWHVTNIAGMYNGCSALKHININWDTTNWSLASLSRVFYGCKSLLDLDFSSWNTTDWAVTTLQDCFNNCYCLQELDLSWDTTNWVVTTMSNIFSGCHSLKTIDMSSWDTSNWEVTTLENSFQNLLSMHKIDLTGWDTSNWPLANIGGMFRYSRMSEIDMRNWDVTNFNVTNVRYMFDQVVTCKVVKLPNFVYSGNSTNCQTGFPNNNTLCYFSGYQLPFSQDYSNAFTLSAESIETIFTRLPTVSSGTITLGQNNLLKITAEQLAIATNKGWTVA